MFTGLIEEVGTVEKVQRSRGSLLIFVNGKKAARSLAKNDSIAIDGVCLTVLRRRRNVFCVQSVEQTLKKTALGRIAEGSRVNLERPLRPTGFLGGHFVLGHVDGVGVIRDIRVLPGSWIFSIQIPPGFRSLLVPAGSIAVNGVSLTIADMKGSAFAVSIIPHTWRNTTFRFVRRGDRVNLEFDVLGKYIQQLLKVRRGRA